MNILGIDYGRKKIGLALAVTELAEPLQVIRYKDIGILSEKIKGIIKREKIAKIVIGISEGEMAKETKAFAKKLSQKISLPIVYFDETLSTYEAKKLAREANLSREKQRDFEDAFAATIMLQSYLDSHV